MITRTTITSKNALSVLRRTVLRLSPSNAAVVVEGGGARRMMVNGGRRGKDLLHRNAFSRPLVSDTVNRMHHPSIDVTYIASSSSSLWNIHQQQHRQHSYSEQSMYAFMMTMSALLAVGSMTASSSSTANCDHSNDSPAPPTVTESVAMSEENAQQIQEEKKNLAAIFLDKDSIDKLRARFPIRYEGSPSPSGLYHHVTLAYDPPEDVLASYAVQMGRPVRIKVIAIAFDNNCETAFVKILPDEPDADESGGNKDAKDKDAEDNAEKEQASKKSRIPENVVSRNKHPHITLSVANGTHASYSNVLLARIAEKAPEIFDDTPKQNDLTWSGDIDESMKNCAIRMVESENIVVSGIVCLRPQWDDKTSECGADTKCGFCRFMKAGPCGSQFQAWEKCIDEGENYVERCVPQTLALKECVDKHPLYYFSVTDKDEEDSPPPTKTDAAAPEGSGASTGKGSE